MPDRDDDQLVHMFERISDAYVALDRDYRYTYVNARAAEIFGRRAQDLIGKHIWTEFPEGVGQPFQRAYEAAMQSQQPVAMESWYPPYNRWFENRIYPSADGLTIYFQDITQRKRQELMNAGHLRVLAGVAAHRPLAESLEQIARLHEELNPGALCSVLLLDEPGERVLHGAAPSLPQAFNQAIHGAPIGEARGSCGAAAFNRTRVIADDISTHPNWGEFKALALAHGLRACWSTPIIGDKDQVLGTFAVYYREPNRPTDEELGDIDRMLSTTAIAIEGAKLTERLRTRDRFFDLSVEINCIFDPQTGRIAQVNPTFCEVTGFSAQELTTRFYLDFVHPDDQKLATEAVSVLTTAGNRVSNVGYRFLCKDGSYRFIEWQSVTQPDGIAFAVGSDMTERHKVEQQLAYVASHDPVTGLLQHALLESELAEALAGGAAGIAVMLIGLDRFQLVNEALGHAVGDDVLRLLARRLELALGDAGKIARFAGDEFIALLRDQSPARAMELAERLRARVAEPIEGDDYRLLLTASIGIAHADRQSRGARELLGRAEGAMRTSKREGRDTVREFSCEHMQHLEDRISLGGQLRRALRGDELELHYQPQFSAGSHALTGFEALLRWNSPSLGAISPGRFIPVAEASGLMPEVGAWVLNAACAQARAWLDRGFSNFTVAVNVSPQQLQRPGLVDQVRQAMARHRIPSGVLDLELTESSLMENVSRVQATLSELKQLGARLSLDDFGTGYSSLSYLKHFPIDKLKIDQGFVRGLPHDPDDAVISQTIVAMAHQLRMVVAAEGVETAEQAQFLGSIGCDELQGYHLGRPAPAREIEKLLR